ncbi:hypothetical protein AURDEDRAFT_109615 [Auricularia subglabra TFB-10046 SS5]|nr:hypothetical protein AURDEDRAFT_109615 [Auricularia subglabra TFB-10046 SS5]
MPAVMTLRAQLSQTVYAYSLLKLQRRAKKHWFTMKQRFQSTILQPTTSQTESLLVDIANDPFLHVQAVLDTLDTAAKSANQSDTASVIAAVTALETFLMAEKKADPGSLEEVENEVNEGSRPEERLDLAKYLKKLTSLATSVQLLFQAAHSRVFDTWSGRNLRFHHVDLSPSASMFHAQFWKSTALANVIKQLITDSHTDLPPNDRLAAVIHETIQRRIIAPLTTTSSNRAANVRRDTKSIAFREAEAEILYRFGNSHAESILLSFFNKSPGLGQQLVERYFGASKVACPPCERLFHAYNVDGFADQGGPELVFDECPYFVRGCHHMPFLPWTLPAWQVVTDEVPGRKTKRNILGALLSHSHDLLLELLGAPASSRQAHVSTSTVASAPAEIVSSPASEVDVEV